MQKYGIDQLLNLDWGFSRVEWDHFVKGFLRQLKPGWKHIAHGRDPLTPIKDAVTADGEVVIPIDVEAFGYWLKAAFGHPTTSGTTPKTHTFQSGNWTLLNMSIETAMPEVPRFAMYSGCVLDQLSWQMYAQS